MKDSIIIRLRNIDPMNVGIIDDDKTEAADMLEFLFSRLVPTINSHDEAVPEDETTWRFSTGYPWQYARGADPETAIRNAMKEAKTGRRELRRMKQAIQSECVKREPTALKGLVR
jgi:hypothetical protein